MVRLKVNNENKNEIVVNFKECISEKISYKFLKKIFSSVIKTKGLKSSVKNGDLLVGYIDDHNCDEKAHSNIISTIETRLDRHDVEINKKINSSALSEVAISGSYDDLSNKPTIPSAVTENTVSGWGFTKNTGTVTSVNNVSPVNGNVTLSIPSIDNLANKDLSNLSTTIGSEAVLSK